MANKKLEPLFWINPNFRLQFPYFSIKWYKIISLSPVLVIFPIDFLDMVILHEMAHLKYMHHKKPFWAYLSVLINDNAKQQNDLRDIVLSKYIELYEFLMK